MLFGIEKGHVCGIVSVHPKNDSEVKYLSLLIFIINSFMFNGSKSVLYLVLQPRGLTELAFVSACSCKWDVSPHITRPCKLDFDVLAKSSCHQLFCIVFRNNKEICVIAVPVNV